MIVATRTVQMHDTGIGREVGYEDDTVLVVAYEAERAALTPEMQQTLRDVDVKLTQAFLDGEPAPATGHR